MDTAVETRGLIKRFGQVEALAGVDLSVAPGQVYGLIGPNGAGKTTLIRQIIGASRPTSGSLGVLGMDPLRDRWTLRRMLGYMPQDVALYDDLSARRNVEFFASPHMVRGLDRAVEDALAMVGLSGRADAPLHTLSGGMRRRVSLACSLVHHPSLAVLDEPTSGIDPELRREFWRVFRDRAADGATVLVSTHYLQEALECDRLVILLRGRVLAETTASDLQAQARWTIRVEKEGEESVYHPTDVERELPDLAAGASRVHVDRESVDDVVFRLIGESGT